MIDPMRIAKDKQKRIKCISDSILQIFVNENLTKEEAEAVLQRAAESLNIRAGWAPVSELLVQIPPHQE